MEELLLEGLDGSNPLGFLAALGTLNIVSDRSDAVGEPRLSWRDEGRWRPILVGIASRDELIARLVEDLATWRGDPSIGLKYGKGSKEARDLKPPPGRYREFLLGLADGASRKRRRGLDFAMSFATDVAVDNNGNTKPTALHFTAGQQQFLLMVNQLVEGVQSADFEEALFEMWRYARPLPVLGWDSSAARDYALRATDPSREKKTGVPGAEWLAFRGLSFLPVAPSGAQISTTGCSGGWKTARFRWPLWEVPLTRATIRSLLTSPELRDAKLGCFQQRGVGIVFESDIRRSEQGGYGSFGPARVI